MPKIALCCFATGRYKEFLGQLAESARRFFLPDDRPDLVAFTDRFECPPGYDRQFRVPHLRWPYGTLYRYRWLAQQTEALRSYEYVFMCDVDMRFVAPVGDEVLGRLVGVLHAGHISKPPSALPFLRYRHSPACIKTGDGQHYYAGGFQGGRATKYLRACRKIDEWIQADEKRGFIPDWHDETYWNSYLAHNPPQVSLGPDYCWGEPDGVQPTTRILALVKPHAEFRADGADPRAGPPEPEPAAAEPPPAKATAIPAEPPSPLAGDQDCQKAEYFVRTSNLPPAIRDRLLGTLGQIRALLERAEPRVVCPGPQGDLEAVLRDLLPSNPVVYVDIGASEPVDCSNTYPFYLDGGYGLLVEPRPSCWYPVLLQRPRDHLWPTAVASRHSFAELIECGGCSSLVPDWSKEVRGRIMVQTMPAHMILERFPDIARACNLLSLDVEGAEEDVISSWPWDRYRPRIVVVEYCVYGDPTRNDPRANELAGLLGQHHYEVVHRNQHNLVFRSFDP